MVVFVYDQFAPCQTKPEATPLRPVSEASYHSICSTSLLWSRYWSCVCVVGIGSVNPSPSPVTTLLFFLLWLLLCVYVSMGCVVFQIAAMCSLIGTILSSGVSGCSPFKSSALTSFRGIHSSARFRDRAVFCHTTFGPSFGLHPATLHHSSNSWGKRPLLQPSDSFCVFHIFFKLLLSKLVV